MGPISALNHPEPDGSGPGRDNIGFRQPQCLDATAPTCVKFLISGDMRRTVSARRQSGTALETTAGGHNVRDGSPRHD